MNDVEALRSGGEGGFSVAVTSLSITAESISCLVMGALALRCILVCKVVSSGSSLDTSGFSSGDEIKLTSVRARERMIL